MVMFSFVPAVYAEQVFLDWNNESNGGTTWVGYIYSSAVSYDKPGWKKENSNNPPYPMSFEKNDYGNSSLATLDTTFLPPSSQSGASFKVFDDGTGSQYTPSWWLWYPYGNMLDEGITTESTNRLSLYLFLGGLTDLIDPNTDGYTFEWGTYTCWEGGAFNGDSCPTESDNGHFYHSATIAPNMWVHVLYDEHPYHQRSVTDFPVNNPTLASDGKDYFANLGKMYFQITRAIENPNSSAFWIDELKFTSTGEMGESNQNDESITTLWVGYQPNDGHWEIGWNDLSVNGPNDKEYEIRWATSPITNANFNSAAVVQPLDFVVNGNHVHKSNGWKMQLWTRFDLPVGAETNSNLYFAVKDVSIADGVYTAPPNSFIHTIDYTLQLQDVSPPPILRLIE